MTVYEIQPKTSVQTYVIIDTVGKCGKWLVTLTFTCTFNLSNGIKQGYTGENSIHFPLLVKRSRGTYGLGIRKGISTRSVSMNVIDALS